jgi:hypothetical protein
VAYGMLSSWHMTEFGVFTDEGMVADEFYARETADAWMRANLSPDDGAHVAEICPDHEGHERANCERCNQDDDISEDR